MSKIKLAIIDDMESVRDYYSLAFNNSEEFVCCGTAGNENEALVLVKNLTPDVILLDIQMDKAYSGLSLIPQILDILPNVKIVVFTVHDDQQTIYQALSLGAKNYCLKTAKFSEIKDVLINCYNNVNLINSEIVSKILSEFKNIEKKQHSLLYLFTKFSNLSSIEIEILRSLCKGKNYKEISEERFVEEVTIRSSSSRIVKKLEYNSVKEMIESINNLKLFDLLDSIKF